MNWIPRVFFYVYDFIDIPFVVVTPSPAFITRTTIWFYKTFKRDIIVYEVPTYYLVRTTKQITLFLNLFMQISTHISSINDEHLGLSEYSKFMIL